MSAMTEIRTSHVDKDVLLGVNVNFSSSKTI